MIKICKSTEDPNGFVGFKIDNNEPRIYFPYGYPIDEITEKSFKTESRYLLYTLIGAKSDNKILSRNFQSNKDSFLYDCIYLVEGFLGKGLYYERENIFTTASNGKINWKRTLNKSNPLVGYQNGLVTGLYFKDIYRQKNIKKDTIITQLQIEALKIAKEKVGFLYSDFCLPNTTIKNPSEYLPFLKDKLRHIYVDDEKKLYEAIINVISLKGNKATPIGFKLGTNHYEVVWEAMLRKVYGNINEKQFLPNAIYKLKEAGSNKFGSVNISHMNPDLIFKSNSGEYYIIDAKYYRYCETNNDSSKLPKSESITKQIIYQQNMEEELINSGEYTREGIKRKNPIHNLFILPFNSSKKNVDEYIPSSIAELSFKGFGAIEATAASGKYVIGLAFKDTKELIKEFNEGKKYHYNRQYRGLVDSYNDYKTSIDLYLNNPN